MDYGLGPETNHENEAWRLADMTGGGIYGVVDQQSKHSKISFIPPERYAADLEPPTRGHN